MSVWYEDGLGDEYWMGSSADAGLGNVTMTITVSAVPEPATHGLLLAGLGPLGALARRRRR